MMTEKIEIETLSNGFVIRGMRIRRSNEEVRRIADEMRAQGLKNQLVPRWTSAARICSTQEELFTVLKEYFKTKVTSWTL